MIRELLEDTMFPTDRGGPGKDRRLVKSLAHREQKRPTRTTDINGMNTSVQIIPLTNLVLAFIPALIVVAVMWQWDMGYKNALYAIFRMLIQLLLIGFFPRSNL